VRAASLQPWRPHRSTCARRCVRGAPFREAGLDDPSQAHAESRTLDRVVLVPGTVAHRGRAGGGSARGPRQCSRVCPGRPARCACRATGLSGAPARARGPCGFAVFQAGWVAALEQIRSRAGMPAVRP